MKFWLSSIVFLSLLLCSQMGHAQGTVIYQDDFEGPVTGWSNNRTDFDPDVTRFLGRFANNPTSTSQTFTIPANTEQVVIEFDLYRFDSWDNGVEHGFDRFEVEIDNNEIFSLPFPNPQAARSGTSANVDWSHTPLTGTVELAFTTGEFWFDQLHRFEIIVNNPGPTLALTLRADLTQRIRDESAGFDNFLITAVTDTAEIIAVAESFSPIDSTSGGTTSSVLSSDTIDGVILNPNEVTITTATSSSSNVTLDQTTGLISVAPNTAIGSYTVDYEICENIDLDNCSSVTETVTVTASGSGPFCPVGTFALPSTYHVISATGGQNPERTVGMPLAEGTTETGANSAVTFFGAITMDLTGDPAILVPEGEVVEIVLSSHFGTAGRAEILMSADGTSYTSLGTTGNGGSVYGAWSSNILRYDDFTVPVGGARFLQVLRQNSGVRADGVIYNTQCHPQGAAPFIAAVDDNATVASSPNTQANVINVIDNDTFDGLTPTSFDLSLSSGSILPSELTFDTVTGEVGVLAGTITGIYSFNYDICEVGNPANCDTATVTIGVTSGGGSTCPAGTSDVPGTYHVISASGGQNPERTVGMPLAEGTTETGANSAVTFFGAITMDLTGDPAILVPEGEVVEIVLSSHFGTAGRAEILMSADGTSYTSLGTTGNGGSVYGAWSSNILRYDDFTVPVGGARFLQVLRQNSGVRADGVIYNTQCQAGGAPTVALIGTKSVAVYDPNNTGIYAVPGNDVIYTILVENTGAGTVDAGSLTLIDIIPSELIFYNGDIDDGGPETSPVMFTDNGSSLTLDFNTNVGFSNAASPPADFAACNYTPIAGYDDAVTYICISPTGTMQASSSWSIGFRAQIE